MLKSIMLVLLCSVSIYSVDKFLLFPNSPIYSKKNYVLIESSQNMESEYLTLFKKKNWTKRSIFHIVDNKLVMHIPSKYMSTLKQEEFEFAEVKQRKFLHFDPTYKTRMQKGFMDLSDLLSGYKDDVLNRLYLKSISEKYKEHIAYYEIGKTTLDRPIPAIRFLNPDSTNLEKPRPSILFNCAHHGNELTSIEHCYDIIYTILKDIKGYKKILEHIDVWVLPIVNPDGVNLFWNFSVNAGRKNGKIVKGQKSTDTNRGVDINRNYPYKWNSGIPKASSGEISAAYYRGESPMSELETQAMSKLFQENRFLLSFSYHASANCILYPYSIDGLKNPDPDYPKNLGKRLGKKATSYVSGREFEVKKNIYSVDGTDQDYFYHEFGTNAFLFETSHQNPEYKKIGLILKGFRPVWQAFLNEYFTAYKIIIRVLDKNKKPLEARIKIREIKYKENEVFTSNPKTGYFFHLVLKPIKYHIDIESDTYGKKTIEYTATKKISPLDIIL